MNCKTKELDVFECSRKFRSEVCSKYKSRVPSFVIKMGTQRVTFMGNPKVLFDRCLSFLIMFCPMELYLCYNPEV